MDKCVPIHMGDNSIIRSVPFCYHYYFLNDGDFCSISKGVRNFFSARLMPIGHTSSLCHSNRVITRDAHICAPRCGL